MASMSTQRLSTDGSSSSNQKYDVFISFRGEDTRNSFTDHLQDALKREGIDVFSDEEKMKRGKPISEELFNAIEASRISIIVLSRNYASSTWCLDELVKIVQCRNDMGQTVIPVYYDVSSSEVKEGIFEQAFIKREETFKEEKEKVQKWRSEMREVTNLKGWELKHRRETQVIAEIVKYISNELHPLGSRLANLEKLLVAGKSCFEQLLKRVEANGTWFQWGPTLTVHKCRNVFFLIFFFF